MPRNFVKPYKRMESRRRIEEMIRSGNLWGQRLMSERELAAKLGVSRWTLQGALAELEADGLLERRQGSGTFVADRPVLSLRRDVANLVIVAGTHFERARGWTYYGDIIRGMLGQAPKLRAECTVLALDQPDEAKTVWKVRRMRRFDGFISVALDRRDLITHLLRLKRGPVVLAEHYIRDLPITGVVDGSFEGMRAVTKHLLALGHQRVAYIDCFNRAAVNPEKFAGYVEALAEKGIELDEELVFEQPALGDPRGHAAAAVRRFLKMKDPPTALAAFDDGRALGAAEELEKHGLEVGRDFAVAGFGDGAVRSGDCDWLTSCRIYTRKMGQQAIRAALERRSASEGKTIIIPDRLFIRRSTCPPPDARPPRDLPPELRRTTHY
ncbi:MAG: substrate-binding domain-containing protein [Planctomycetota bacterium]